MGPVWRDPIRVICELGGELRMGAPSSRCSWRRRTRYQRRVALYRRIRPQLSVELLSAYFAAHPASAKEWVGYSEDKRTSSGWALIPASDGGWTVFEPFAPASRASAPAQQFTALADAAGAYLLLELDHWWLTSRAGVEQQSYRGHYPTTRLDA